MFRRSSPTVVIAGAGPSGLLGALCLAEQGVDIEIVSPTHRDPALRRRSTNGAVVVLHPGSLELLQRHGVAAAVLERAVRVRAVRLYQGAECTREVSFERLAQESTLPIDFAACVARADLEDCLRAALRERRVEVHDQRRLARFEQGAARVRVTIDHLDSDSAGYAVAHSEMVVDRSEELEPEFVLAADGHQSAVRQQLGLALRELGTTEQYLVVEGLAASPPPEEGAISFVDAEGSAIWPLPGGRQHGVFRLTNLDVEELGLHEAAQRAEAGSRLRLDRARLSAWLTERLRGMPIELSDLDPRGPFHADHRLASGFGRGRVWLAGAAAHCASPMSSLSTNVGLGEAAQLADIFASAEHRETPLDALAAYELERLQRWQQLLEPGQRDASRGAQVDRRAGAARDGRPASMDFDAVLAQLTTNPRSAAAAGAQLSEAGATI